MKEYKVGIHEYANFCKEVCDAYQVMEDQIKEGKLCEKCIYTPEHVFRWLRKRRLILPETSSN